MTSGRSLLHHFFVGVATGWVTLGGMMHGDVAGLGELIAGAEQPQIPFLMLAWAFGGTFGIAAMASGTTIHGEGRPGSL